MLAVTLRSVPWSLPSTLAPVSGVLTGVLPLSSAAAGVTVIRTVAVAVSPPVAVIVYVKVSGPE